MSLKYFLALVSVFLIHQHIPFNSVYSQIYDLEEYSSTKEFPSIVRIFHNGEHLCAGYIVSEELIITPNHCVVNYTISNLKVLVRYLNIPERMYDVLEVINHSHFTWSPLIQNDIAFLKIPSNFLHEGEGVGIIRLASNHFEDPGEGVFASWGCSKYKTECKRFVMLRKMIVKVVPTEECSQAYWDVSNANINDEKICAGNFRARRGESGGGLIAYTENNTPVLFGILSFYSCLDSFNYKCPVFTRLSSHSEFINKYITSRSEFININSSTQIQQGHFLCTFILIFYIFVHWL